MAGHKALNQGNAERALLEYETAVTLQPHRAPYQVAVGLIGRSTKQV
ncbi:MAG: hypothetical protein M5U34_43800 [Chloroflexi bacterium]|nr:hypothetical protein [Chloroflexota bacterium]